MLDDVYEERGLTLRDMTYAKARDMIEIEKLVNRPDYCSELIALRVKLETEADGEWQAKPCA